MVAPQMPCLPVVSSCLTIGTSEWSLAPVSPSQASILGSYLLFIIFTFDAALTMYADDMCYIKVGINQGKTACSFKEKKASIVDTSTWRCQHLTSQLL